MSHIAPVSPPMVRLVRGFHIGWFYSHLWYSHNPKALACFGLFLKQEITGGTNEKTKESEKEGPLYPLYSSLPLLLNGNSPKMPMLFGLRLHQGWEYNNLEPRDKEMANSMGQPADDVALHLFTRPELTRKLSPYHPSRYASATTDHCP